MNATMDRARLMTWIATGAARGARERAGWTQKRVAEHVGVTVRTVVRWETEGRMPMGNAATCYYELLDLWLNTPEVLLSAEKDPER